MVAIESKDDLYVINLLEDFDEFYLDLEKFAEENRVPIIDKIGIRSATIPLNRNKIFNSNVKNKKSKESIGNWYCNWIYIY